MDRKWNSREEYLQARRESMARIGKSAKEREEWFYVLRQFRGKYQPQNLR